VSGEDDVRTCKGIHGIEGWVGPRPGLEAVEKRRISCPCLESSPAVQPVARSPSLYRLNYPAQKSNISQNYGMVMSAFFKSDGVQTVSLPEILGKLRHLKLSLSEC
jgi:hypothetical protein